jgi:hypothetical protein
LITFIELFHFFSERSIPHKHLFLTRGVFVVLMNLTMSLMDMSRAREEASSSSNVHLTSGWQSARLPCHHAVTLPALVYDKVRDTSLHKLHLAAVARREPPLRRSVLIANLLRQPVRIVPSTNEVPLNYFSDDEPLMPVHDESVMMYEDEMEEHHRRLAEAAWFDACFAELDDDDEDEDDMVCYDDDVMVVGSCDSVVAGTTSATSPPTTVPELSPTWSDAGGCEGLSDSDELMEPCSPPSPTVADADLHTTDTTTNTAFKQVSPVACVEECTTLPDKGQPRIVRPLWKIHVYSE